MTFEEVRAFLTEHGLGNQVYEFDRSSATVELAAQAVGCEPGRIAKTMSFLVEGEAVLVVLAGDTRVDNARFKAQFHQKATMLPAQSVGELTGFPVGGVCPFGVKTGVAVYLDESLKRFEAVYPAAGSPNSAVKLTIEQLEELSKFAGWVDIGKRA